MRTLESLVVTISEGRNSNPASWRVLDPTYPGAGRLCACARRAQKQLQWDSGQMWKDTLGDEQPSMMRELTDPRGLPTTSELANDTWSSVPKVSPTMLSLHMTSQASLSVWKMVCAPKVMVSGVNGEHLQATHPPIPD